MCIPGTTGDIWKERVIAFIPDYVAYLITGLEKGEDGRVSYERIKGKKPTIMGVEFGEKVLFKRRRGRKLEKLNERWQYGIMVGVRRKSNELMVATKLGIDAEIGKENNIRAKMDSGLIRVGETCSMAHV